jgi:hypothetical protein
VLEFNLIWNSFLRLEFYPLILTGIPETIKITSSAFEAKIDSSSLAVP